MTPSRLKRIRKRLDQLRQGTDVQLRDIATALGPDRFEAMEAAWEEQLKLRKPEKPAAIKSYEDALNKAVLLHGKLDAQSGRGKNTDALRRRVDKAFEAAWEVLQEVVESDQSLRSWFDRDIDFGFDTHLGLDPVRMPRVLTSRSLDNVGDAKSAFNQIKRRQHKREALEAAEKELADLLMTDEQKHSQTQQVQADAAKLQSMLKKLKKMGFN